MLEVSDVSKTYPKRETPTLSSVSFAIEKGEAAALIGENGAGKTTLIRILSTIMQPNKGTVYLNGHNVLEDISYSKQRTSVLFSGDCSLYDRLTGRENILYYAQLNGIKRSDSISELDNIIKELALTDFIDQKISSYSRGQKQRTAIARSLITNPDFLILDEPSTGLDIIGIKSVTEILNRLKKNGKTILFSSHNVDEIFNCADRILVLHHGKIRCNLKIDEYIGAYGRDFTLLIKN